MEFVTPERPSLRTDSKENNMTHGGPHPQSSASYIIICSGRIAVAIANKIEDKIDAASKCAAQLCSFIESTANELNSKDFLPIQTLQHELMDHLLGIDESRKLKDVDIEHKIAEMFLEFDALEDKYSGHTY